MIYPYESFTPQIAESAFVAPGACVIGNVTVGERASIWFNCVVRGDINQIKIGNDSNIQDGCLLHVTSANQLIVEDMVTAGHGVIMHGCHIRSRSLIGMGAILLDGAVIGSGSIVAAGALVSPGMIVPEGSLVTGVPGKVARPLTDADRERIERTWQNYVRYAGSYKQMLPPP